MNKIYRLKFDKRRNELVVVSEIATGMGKEKSTGHIAVLSDISTFRKLLGTLTPLALLTGLVISLFPGMALANPDLPTGGQIVGGQGSISTSGNQMTIHQQTQNMATNWHSFDVGKNNTVQFVQPDSSSVALNRVTGASGSQIMGTLKANGQVFILNPNGVLFGKDARVNVAGLVASTKNINAADFMKGQYTLSGEGNPGSQVVNQGSLTTSKGGYIVLAGERVSNSGTVTTPGGKTVLAAGKTVTLQLDNGGLTSVSVNGSVVNALVENRGLISATDGQVYLTAKGKDMLLNTVVNNSGTIEAKGLESRGGEIVLNGGDSGVVNQSGTLLADSHTGQGGKITLEGQNIHLAGNSLTSATGKTGGGEVYVGGGWQGKDSRIRNASKVVMDKTATIDVSATDAGNGGTAVLWSDDYTNFRGTVLAKGGTQSGNGGRVETSSHKNLQAFGDVDTSARAGKGGEWLLDPTNVTIVGTPDSESGVTSSTDSGTDTFTPTASGAKILNTSIVSQLNNGTNVTVKTSGPDTGGQPGNIMVNADIRKTKGGNATLTLNADGNIFVGKNAADAPGGRLREISSSGSGGKLGLTLLAGGTGNSGKIDLGRDVNISLNGGDFYAGPAEKSAGNKAAVSLNFLNNGKIQANDITMNVSGGLGGYAYKVLADNNLTINGSVQGNTGYGVPLQFIAGNKLKLNAASGNISITSTDETSNPVGGIITISGKKGVDINAQEGAVSLITNTGDKFGLDVRSDGGDVSLFGKVQDGTDGLTLTNVNITSKGKTTLNGTTFWGKAAKLTGLNITAGGDVDISGTAKRLHDGELGGSSAQGIKLSGSNIESKKGNITLTGFAATDKKYQDISTLEISNSNLTANSSEGKISLNGTTGTTTGIRVAGSNFSAASLDIKGVATQQGTGFSLTNSKLLDKLADLTHVTFSSLGSAAGVINKIDSSLIPDETSRNNLLEKHIENMTSVDMNGAAVFADSEKGWKMNASSSSTPNGGWIFNHTSVNAGDTVDLKGVSFTNSTINVTKGDLNIENKGPLWLTGTNVTVKNNISLTSTEGGVSVSGPGGKNPRSVIKSDGGDIQLTGTTGKVNTIGVDVSNADLVASAGNVSIKGINNYVGSLITESGIQGDGGYAYAYGSRLSSINISAENVDVSGKGVGTTTAGVRNASRGIVLSDFNITSSQNLNMDGFSSGKPSGWDNGQPAGIYISSGGKITAQTGSITGTGDVNGIVFRGEGKLTLSGGLSVKGNSTGDYGGYSGGILFTGWNGQLKPFDLNIEKGSNVSVAGNGVNKGIAVIGQSAPIAEISLINKGAELKVTGTATGKKGQGIFLAPDADNMGNQEKSHIKLSSVDGGKTELSGIADGEEGTGVSKVIIDTEGVTAGEVVISGQGGKDGITINSGSNISNIQVSGKGNTGTGVQVVGNVTMKDAKVTGETDTGIATLVNKGAKVTSDPSSELNGESTGTGKGVVLGSNSSVSGGILTATSVDGSGLKVESGAKADSVKINAQTVNGQAIEGNDNALIATETTSISTVGKTGNTNISDKVKPVTGVTPSGVVAEAFDKLRESIATLKNALNTKSADLGGLQQTMVTLQKQFDQAVHTGAIGQPDLKRLEIVVNGLSDRLRTATVTVAELKEAISSLTVGTVGDVGTLQERQRTADSLSVGLQGVTLPAAGDISAVAGELSAAKTLQSATVSLQGSLAARADEDGKVRHLLDSLQQQLKDAQEKGTAGRAVLAGMQTQLESLYLQQRSYEEAVAHIRQNLATVSQDGSSPVTGRQDSVNRLQTALSGVSGISDGQVSALGNQLQQATTGYAQLVTAVQQQGSVNAQMPLQSRDQQDGFHAGGEPMVPVHGYQAQPQNVDIRLCDGEGCRSVTLDVAKPSQGLMVASTESR